MAAIEQDVRHPLKFTCKAPQTQQLACDYCILFDTRIFASNEAVDSDDRLNDDHA